MNRLFRNWRPPLSPTLLLVEMGDRVNTMSGMGGQVMHGRGRQSAMFLFSSGLFRLLLRCLLLLLPNASVRMYIRVLALFIRTRDCARSLLST